mmetsp:Transcript_42781/g.103938  ORF Transcript_42781/g.103938 Transcript_42781/m.103938 type:complete len:95 (+) Transcript_42781:712-996(+)
MGLAKPRTRRWPLTSVWCQRRHWETDEVLETVPQRTRAAGMRAPQSGVIGAAVGLQQVTVTTASKILHSECARAASLFAFEAEEHEEEEDKQAI